MKLYIHLFSAIILVACSHSRQMQELAEIQLEHSIKQPKLTTFYKQAENLQNIRSLLVWQDGQLIGEGYFRGYSGDSLDHIRSVTKSIMSILIGIAIDQQIIEDVDDPIGKYIGHLLDGYEREKQSVTIKQLLTMSGGFKWHEDDNSDFNNWMRSTDHLDFLMNRKIVDQPGSTFNYNSAGAHLLSILLTEVTGTSTLEFAKMNLFEPLGISDLRWKQVSGYYSGAASLELKPKDLLKIGVMMISGGKFGGRVIVSESWVRQSTRTQIGTGNGSERYGYLWWIQDFENNGMYSAFGYGGQMIIITPNINSVLVITSDWINTKQPQSTYVKALRTFLLDNWKIVEQLNKSY